MNTTNEIEDNIYVLDHNGILYTSPEVVVHSYFLKSNDPTDVAFGVGKDVASAGHLIVKNGKIIEINNESGHYTPNEDQLKIAVHFLASKGVACP